MDDNATIHTVEYSLAFLLPLPRLDHLGHLQQSTPLNYLSTFNGCTTITSFYTIVPPLISGVAAGCGGDYISHPLHHHLHTQPGRDYRSVVIDTITPLPDVINDIPTSNHPA